MIHHPAGDFVAQINVLHLHHSGVVRYFIAVQGAWPSDHHEFFMLWVIMVHINTMKRGNLCLCVHTSLLRSNLFEPPELIM